MEKIEIPEESTKEVIEITAIPYCKYCRFRSVEDTTRKWIYGVDLED